MRRTRSSSYLDLLKKEGDQSKAKENLTKAKEILQGMWC
jgi:hypothetical protein